MRDLHQFTATRAHSKVVQETQYKVTSKEVAARFLKSVLTNQEVLPD